MSIDSGPDVVLSGNLSARPDLPVSDIPNDQAFFCGSQAFKRAKICLKQHGSGTFFIKNGGAF
jgi:hypothetical protein